MCSYGTTAAKREPGVGGLAVEREGKNKRRERTERMGDMTRIENVPGLGALAARMLRAFPLAGRFLFLSRMRYTA